jgi:predicted RNase H-like nuclease (RuvC/YqgF family)
MNDVEFVNVYIVKLKATIDDLLNKNIILETRLSLLEPKVAQYQTELATLQQKLTSKEKKEKKTEENTF